MKTLELNQMENLQGGDLATGISCAGAIAGIVGATTLAIAGGPVGWLAWGSALLSGLTTGAALGSCAYGLTH